MDAKDRYRQQSRRERIQARIGLVAPKASATPVLAAPRSIPDPRAWLRAMLFMSALLGFFALFASWAASPTVYTCYRAEAGASCVVESRMMGFFVLDRREVEHVYNTGSASSTEVSSSLASRSEQARQDRRTSTTTHSFSLVDRYGGALYQDTTTSTPIGVSATELGGAIRALADGTRSAAVRGWRVGWPPLLVATVLWPIVTAMLIDGFRGGRAAGPPRRAWVYAWLMLLAVLSIGVWTLTLLGHYPDWLATALSVPGG